MCVEAIVCYISVIFETQCICNVSYLIRQHGHPCELTEHEYQKTKCSYIVATSQLVRKLSHLTVISSYSQLITSEQTTIRLTYGVGVKMNDPITALNK